ncbi:putative membrane protein YphA (DoxX/SURF4 family) [Methylohalomonas lacus]|uniref:Membrane protein YphA (DoxX/SURF4 family) n=2 Tax=Methylohalomonas lacus TaxID=398773 RepID=A0AAE3L2I0_9GAMM|nr:DoxX family protein [Methylohalomonas lacus]MCS3904601.1 putative membrane protein YphA (DoxX/SURF4 family) [Methylohalomonas lacus]
MLRMLNRLQDWLDQTRSVDFIAPLLLRLYLAPIFLIAGSNKLDGFMPDANTVSWFGNPDWGLGLPLPWLMTFLAAYSEVLGGAALLLGLAVRWFSIPLMVTMLVAIFSVHLKNGWQAIADPTMCLFNCEAAQAAVTRLDKAKDILREHGNYNWLTEQGNFVVLNNGIEFAATYFIMLLALFFIGAGRYLSLDYWIARAWRYHD